ncbi:MAG: hypothetical protein H6748_04295 [Spirochaetaceae bacterium]|nr:hypothetical protein [Myxococcales bacterium]MCB9723252.1 hypothetical protein [Spirochaetaceae bacterium]
MFELFGLLGLSTFIATSYLVGARLTLRGLRTRELPQAMLGSALLLSGGLNLSLLLPILFFPELPAAISHRLGGISLVLGTIGYLEIYVFVWLVFRRESRWGLALLTFCAVTLLAGLVGDLLTRQPGQLTIGDDAWFGPWLLLFNASRLVAYTWGGCESLAYYVKMRRRLALGLADPALVARFGYWSLCMFSIDVIWAAQIVAVWLRSMGERPLWTSHLIASMGFLVAITLHRAFAPARHERSASDPVVGADAG